MAVARIFTSVSAIAGLTLLLHIVEGGAVAWIVEPSAAITVVGVTLGALIMSYGIREPWSDLGRLAASPGPGEPKDYRAVMGALRLTAQVAPLAGLLAVILGLVHSMGIYGEPSSLGPSMGSSFTGLFYALAITATAYGTHGFVQSRLAWSAPETPRQETPDAHAGGAESDTTARTTMDHTVGE